MLLKKIQLHNFRNFDDDSFIFNPFLTVIIGENSKGKTNLLESIFFLTNGQGFRETKEEELIEFKKKQAFVEGVFQESDDQTIFKIVLQIRDEKTLKAHFVDKAKKILANYLKEQTKAVLFTPHQIEIITGPPSGRREYFDATISFYDLEYRKRLANYQNGLRKRNKLLEFHHDSSKLKEELKFWDDFLIANGQYLTNKRKEYTDYLNKNNKIDSKELRIKYLKNEITPDRLDEKFELETRVRKTLIGPQKDDFEIYLKDKDEEKNVHHFGSRSEQRLSILWLKINEVKYYEEMFKKRPIILLDDIFSEFDIKNKKLVTDVIKGYQTVVTTTEVEVLQLIESPKSIIKL